VLSIRLVLDAEMQRRKIWQRIKGRAATLALRQGRGTLQVMKRDGD
jgi:hypothetical protein